MKKELPEWIFKKWHGTGITQHIWSHAAKPEYSYCVTCNVNRGFEGDMTLCQGMKFEDWLKEKYPKIAKER